MTLLSSTLLGFFSSNTVPSHTLFVQSCYHSKTCPIPGHRSLFFLHPCRFCHPFFQLQIVQALQPICHCTQHPVSSLLVGGADVDETSFFVENLAKALTSSVGLTRFSFVQEVKEDMQL
ncbi:hypothetical protein F5H01DRAFT_347414 [Linnemannia elongata]|nr:hypothetical protein F5H01DRAFT_347414 [Linnemannia elongata]